MSTLKVEVVKIDDIMPHPNADRLELAQVKGWQVVTQKGLYKPGDLCVYIPIDSILPHDVESKLFPPDSKVKLTKSRIKTIKLRGAISQGMIVSFQALNLYPKYQYEGTDLTEALGIKKYEPPVPNFQTQGGPGKRSPKQVNQHFKKYTSIENFKNYNKLFEPSEEIVATEKIHGTNFRAGYVPFDANTLWKKIKKFFGCAPKYEFVYGSHNVQLQNKIFYKGYYDNNVYAKAVVDYHLREKLKPGEVIYGEIFGPNIQKGYHYGKKDGEQGFVVFDVMVDGKWLDHEDLYFFCLEKQLHLVPVLYKGLFKDLNIDKMVDGDSILAPTQKTREGIVIRPMNELHTYMGRKILKCINPEYLLKDQTDFH